MQNHQKSVCVQSIRWTNQKVEFGQVKHEYLCIRTALLPGLRRQRCHRWLADRQKIDQSATHHKILKYGKKNHLTRDWTRRAMRGRLALSPVGYTVDAILSNEADYRAPQRITPCEFVCRCLRKPGNNAVRIHKYSCFTWPNSTFWLVQRMLCMLQCAPTWDGGVAKSYEETFTEQRKLSEMEEYSSHLLNSWKGVSKYLCLDMFFVSTWLSFIFAVWEATLM